MWNYKPALVTFGVLAAGLAVAGCTSGSSSSGSAVGATSAPAATGTAPAPAATSPAPTQAATSPAAGGSVAASGTCQPSGLRIALGAKTGTSQVTQVVDMTNTGSSTCTLDGFPGVNLVGTVSGKQGYTWPLVRQAVSYSEVTLQPGATAHFDLWYLPWASSGAGTEISVTTIVITPPNDYNHVTVSWQQPILLQDAATHPGTFISPVAPGV